MSTEEERKALRERIQLLRQTQVKDAVTRMLGDMVTVEDTHYISVLGAVIDTDAQTILFNYEILERPDMNDLQEDNEE